MKVVELYLQTKYNQDSTLSQRCLINETVRLCPPLIQGLTEGEDELNDDRAVFMTILNSFEAARRVVRFKVPHPRIMSSVSVMSGV